MTAELTSKQRKIMNPFFKHFLKLLPILLFISSCDFPGSFFDDADKSFGDQHFKTTIALVELHNLRYEEYPNSLSDLKHIGEWDIIAFQSVEYKKLSKGYELNVGRGFVGQADLSFPKDFWQGLGIKKTNVKGFEILKSN